MKLKKLESMLSEIDPFENPKIDLEQVCTSPHIAARMIFTAANTYEDIESCNIGDFGCGPGILSIASSFMGAGTVCGFDCDQDALDTAWVNVHKMDVNNVDLVNVDIQSLQLARGFDTVLMNPPFGTRNTGIDSQFVTIAMRHATTVYSLHKTSTRDHFIRLAGAQNLKIEVIAELRYELPKVHKFHKQKSKDIEVDLYRFTHLS